MKNPVAVVIVFLLAGCAPRPDAAEGFPADVPQVLKVRAPKDARGIAACDLLTADQLTTLGLDPATARPDSRGLGTSCQWDYVDQPTFAGLDISTHPDATKLPGMYRLHHDKSNFEILDIAGHPAIRSDPQPEVQCTLAVGIADMQNLGVGGYYDRKARPDQCAQSRRMAEFVLSNLPPLVEEPR